MVACPNCSQHTWVVDVYRNKRRRVTTRRRECPGCALRLTTRETIVIAKPGGRGFTKVIAKRKENRQKRKKALDTRLRLG